MLRSRNKACDQRHKASNDWIDPWEVTSPESSGRAHSSTFAPVSDPAALSEFKGRENLPLVKALSPVNRADKLAGRAVWIVIGDQDERVSTGKAIELARAITTASIAQKVDSKVELRVMPEPRGHTTPKGSAVAAAQWIHEQISGSVDE